MLNWSKCYADDYQCHYILYILKDTNNFLCLLIISDFDSEKACTVVRGMKLIQGLQWQVILISKYKFFQQFLSNVATMTAKLVLECFIMLVLISLLVATIVISDSFLCFSPYPFEALHILL